MPWRTIQLLNVYLKLRDISQEDIRRALKNKGYKLSPAQVSRIVNGGQGARAEYVDVIVDLVGLPKEELWTEVDPEVAIAKIRQAVKEVDSGGKGLPAVSALDPLPTLEDIAAVRHLHALPATDYTLAEANGLFAIESIDEGDERTYRLPIWPEDVAATAFASNNARHATEFAWLKPSEKRIHGAKLRALRVCGDSMNQAGIDAGDVIFVRMDSDATKSQGEIAVISQHDGMTVKRVRGSKGVPESTNPVHREVDIDPDAKLARVVGVHKPAKT